jgi:hypothetical protein
MRTLANAARLAYKGYVGGGGERAGVVGRDPIDAWRAQVGGEPPTFARDLAHVLLHELERLQVTDGAGRAGAAATPRDTHPTALEAGTRGKRT